MTSFVPRVKFSELHWYFHSLKSQSFFHHEGYDFQFLSRSSWSFKLISEFLVSEQKENSSFWIPEFFCNQALNELRKTKLQIQFYPVTDELEPDWTKCNEMLGKMMPGAFLLVHYFGRVSNSKVAREFCKIHGAYLIEDATHFVKPNIEMFNSADFILCSPYKFFPISEGAVLYSNSNSIKGFKTNSLISSKNNYKWLIKSLIKLLMPSVLLRKLNRGKPDFDLKNLITNPLPPINITQMSFNYLSHLKESKLQNINRVRQKNFKLGTTLLKSFKAESFNEVYFFPFAIMVKNKNSRQIYHKLSAMNIACSPWPDLPPEVLCNDETAAKKYKDELILIPVFEGVQLT